MDWRSTRNKKREHCYFPGVLIRTDVSVGCEEGKGIKGGVWGQIQEEEVCYHSQSGCTCQGFDWVIGWAEAWRGILYDRVLGEKNLDGRIDHK